MVDVTLYRTAEESLRLSIKVHEGNYLDPEMLHFALDQKKRSTLPFTSTANVPHTIESSLIFLLIIQKAIPVSITLMEIDPTTHHPISGGLLTWKICGHSGEKKKMPHQNTVVLRGIKGIKNGLQRLRIDTPTFTLAGMKLRTRRQGLMIKPPSNTGSPRRHLTFNRNITKTKYES